MRGKDFSDFFKVRMTGITPAYAGKSIAAMDLCPAGQDHPRVCGEKIAHAQIPVHIGGSPPRMRGKD